MLIRIRVYVKDKACTEEKIVGQRVATRVFFVLPAPAVTEVVQYSGRSSSQ